MKRKDVIQTTRNKALIINQEPGFYGSFAEIGAGQEVARHFFQAGLASQTVAKSMSAYDKVFSDSIYGKGSRFVSRERLKKMLDHELDLLLTRLNEREDHTSFFAFANTVATSSHEDNSSCHGWLGIKFQTKPKGPLNEILVHVRMLDRLRLQQQEALGILGVNLVYGARHLLSNGPEFTKSLMDNLTTDRLEVDFIQFSGDDLNHIDTRLMSLELVLQGMSRAVMFDHLGQPLCPSDVLYKKNIFVQRGTFRPVTKTNMDILDKGLRHFQKDLGCKKEDLLSFFEITMGRLAQGHNNKVDQQDFLDRVDTICATKQRVLVTNFHLFADLAAYLRRMTDQGLGLVVGASTLESLLDPQFYESQPGGMMSAFARMFEGPTQVYVYPFAQAKNRLTAVSFKPKPPMNHLYQYFLETGKIKDIEGCDQVDTALHSDKVRALLAKGNPEWENLVPNEVRDLIKKRKLFAVSKRA